MYRPRNSPRRSESRLKAPGPFAASSPEIENLVVDAARKRLKETVPALTCADRLDGRIDIPLPYVAGLVGIFRTHLQDEPARRRSARGGACRKRQHRGGCRAFRAGNARSPAASALHARSGRSLLGKFLPLRVELNQTYECPLWVKYGHCEPRDPGSQAGSARSIAATCIALRPRPNADYWQITLQDGAFSIIFHP